jgi:DDE family transposase
LACRELDDALGLTNAADEYLHESRTGENIRHKLVPLLRQSVYSRLAGYDDTNGADRLSQDPAIRVVVGWKGSDSNAASASEMGRFETEWLTQQKNLKGLSLLNTRWVRQAMAHTVNRRVILDIDSAEVRCMASRKDQPTMVTLSVSAITRSFASTSSETAKGRC